MLKSLGCRQFRLNVLAGRDGRITRRTILIAAALDALDANFRIRIDEEGDRIAVRSPANGPDTMDGGAESVVGPTLHEVAGVDEQGAGHRRRGMPLSVSASDFQSTNFILVEQRDRAIIGVCSRTQLCGGGCGKAAG